MRNRAWRFALMAILACLCSMAVMAADPDPSPEGAEVTPPKNSSPSNSLGSFDSKAPSPGLDELGRMMGYILLFGAVAVAGFYFLKNGFAFNLNRSNEPKKLQVLEMRSLGNRQFLLVVGYEEQRFLLGVTPGKIDYLCTLDSTGGTTRDFGAMMEDVIKKEIKS